MLRSVAVAVALASSIAHALPSDLAAASTSPRDPADNNTGVFHGSYSTADGRVWRYHQIYSGVFVGVDSSEWDDSVHVQNDQELDISSADLPTRNTSFATGDLGERDLSELCSAVLDCIIGTPAFAMRLGSHVMDLTTSLWAAGGKDIWAFMNTPFVANFGGITIYSIVKDGTGFGQPKPKPATPSSCSTQNSDVDLYRSILQAAIAAKPDASCVQINVTAPGGQVWSVSVATEPGKCGAPNSG